MIQGEIDVIGTATQKVTNVVIKGNIIDTSPINNGIYVEYASGGVVSDNVINGASSGVYFTNSDTFLVDGNTLSNCQYDINDASGVPSIQVGINVFNNINHARVTGAGAGQGSQLELTNTSPSGKALKAVQDAATGNHYTSATPGTAPSLVQGITRSSGSSWGTPPTLAQF